MSPGTSSSIGISRRRVAGVLPDRTRRPSRSTAVLVRTSARSACADLFERNSCTKRSTGAEDHHEADDDHRFAVAGEAGHDGQRRDKKLNGLANARPNSAYHVGRLLVRDFVAAVTARGGASTSSSVSPARPRSSDGERGVGVTIRELREPRVRRARRSLDRRSWAGGAEGARWNDRGHVTRAATAGWGCADIRNRSVPDSGQFRIFMAPVNGRGR